MAKLYTAEHLAFNAADAAWSAEIVRVFGKKNQDARYYPRGKGEPGSELRRLYDARDAARRAWEAAQ